MAVLHICTEILVHLAAVVSSALKMLRAAAVSNNDAAPP
jgi:hypothetical protein